MAQLNVDTIVNTAGTGAPTFTFGLKTTSFSNLVNAVSSANYTVTDTDGYSVIAVATGGSNRTVTLPTLADNLGRSITVQKTDSAAGYVYIDGEGSETINGSTSATTFGAYVQYDSVTVTALAGGWLISANNTQEVSFSANTTTTAGSSTTPFVFTNELHDTHGAYSTSTGEFVVPVAGTYSIQAQSYAGATAITTMLYLNGSLIVQGSPQSTASYASAVGIIRRFSAGDIITVRPDTSATASGGAALNYFSASRTGF